MLLALRFALSLMASSLFVILLSSSANVQAKDNLAFYINVQMLVLEDEQTLMQSADDEVDTDPIELEVRQSVLFLIEQMNKNEKLPIGLLLALENESPPLNAAEYYLLYRMYAYQAYHAGKLSKAVDLSNKAISYEEKIATTQLNTPLFFDLYLSLAHYYSEIEEYQNAYDIKDIYMDRYRASRIKEKDTRIKLLNEKYETAIKQNENELLRSQSELKQLRLKEAENEKYTQMRNIGVLTVVALIFMALLVRQNRVRKRLKVLAKTDSLTGLYNRRSLFHKGNILVKEAVKEGKSISTILLDIDFFKAVNDQFGHDVGDKVIKKVAEIGCETIRSRDYFARLGGEEFAVILPDANLDESKAFAERLREKVEQMDLSDINIDHSVTVSIGVANLTQVPPVFDDLLHAADEAMYNAKMQGRNCVSCYQIRTNR
ncbi:GGDEF domain-containing protein [Thalassotalea piscium]